VVRLGAQGRPTRLHRPSGRRRGLAAWILSRPVAAGVQWLVLTVLTVTTTLALYDVMRRIRVARVLMGMRVESRTRVPNG
jgi:hypothetical protein